ncbi:MAG TPA: FlgT C-terminal domain-containing protein, partial [Pyrinomonadaceae bacterium]|nr:FlgT C-terminal domain-containing protein [Pyrinomonadaceae bacterium]
MKKAITHHCGKLLVSIIFSLSPLCAATFGQDRPISVTAPVNREYRIAERNNLYCAGYVQTSPIETSRRIVGAQNEQDGWLYSQPNILYLNVGANSGVKQGDEFAVVRPRGKVKTRWTNKGDLGFYVQEVGTVEVVRVKSEFSVARVKTSCDNMLLGDLILPVEKRESPIFTQRPALDLFAEPSGKASGRLFMARDNREVLGRENIIYVDLGAEDNVKVGDFLTIYRPLGKGNLFINDEDESVSARQEGFQSFAYRGG